MVGSGAVAASDLRGWGSAVMLLSAECSFWVAFYSRVGATIAMLPSIVVDGILKRETLLQ